ncbi:MAG: thiamine pyrophosphate-dependent dehydrogenase component subunit alpha [Chloroflexi bacterium]|nr:thiamine pyrophosphate-dependent dehydrogenase component subunit alpha [Chloroflexota bacterium]
MTATWPADRLVGLYCQMYLVRRFEERCLELSRKGLIPGSIHLCIGQEAAAVGAASALRSDDLTVATYRGHGHVLARGIDPRAAFAEVLGRQTGLCKGRGGSMHLTDMSHGVLPPNSIVGAGLPIATGAALAQLHKGADRVVLCSFGEGTLNQGGAHEALNLAAIWSLPVIFLCENNQYSEMTPAYQMIKGDSFATRVAAYGMPTTKVDGMNVQAVAEAVAQAVTRARNGEGPSYVEADTYRFLGHYQGDPGTSYRPVDEINYWRARDPLLLLAAQLSAEAGMDMRLKAEEESIEVALDTAQQAALDDPLPLRDDVWEGLYAAG